MDLKEIATQTVQGYVRNAKELFRSSKHVLFQNMPPLIPSIIISYYLIPAYFELNGKDVEISEDTRVITYKEGDGWDNTTYSFSVSSVQRKICV